MAVQTDHITDLLKEQILNFKPRPSQVDVGEVIEVGDGIALISGLQGAMSSELVEFTKTGVLGIVLNLTGDNVGVIIMGDYTTIEEGDLVRSTGRIAQVPVGDAVIGRVINAIGQPIDGKGPIASDRFRLVERIAPGVIKRQPVNTPVQTGIMAVDALIPIGRGQRELIIGDRQTGKTAIALDTIINQKGKDLI
jgi:F-type H+-transporting ATPase subunit alpha